MPPTKLPNALNREEIIALRADPCKFPNVWRPLAMLSAAPTIPFRGVEFDPCDSDKLAPGCL